MLFYYYKIDFIFLEFNDTKMADTVLLITNERQKTKKFLKLNFLVNLLVTFIFSFPTILFAISLGNYVVPISILLSGGYLLDCIFNIEILGGYILDSNDTKIKKYYFLMIIVSYLCFLLNFLIPYIYREMITFPLILGLRFLSYIVFIVKILFGVSCEYKHRRWMLILIEVPLLAGNCIF